ncbi:MAG: PmbA protein [Actinomycetota bacterium]|nr:PmbA protein [Actinomycetota bacterium]
MKLHGPLDPDDARKAAGPVLDLPGADDVEVVVAGSNTGLTRYANSEIIQNTLRNEVRVYVRVTTDKRVATSTTNQLDADHVRKAAETALLAARASRPDDEFPGVADPKEVGKPKPVYRWDEATANSGPDKRAEAVRTILGATKGCSAAGVYETSAHSFSVVNSRGVDCHDAYTRCVTTCLADSGDGTGWGESSSHAAAQVDPESIARTAQTKATAPHATGDVEPGSYQVVLEPAAMAMLVDFLSYMGFGAKSMIEGESFLSSKLDQAVAASMVTISDDVRNPLSVGLGFDLEGVPKQKVDVIESGIAKRPVTDLKTAAKLKTKSTGHASGSSEFGPYASNVVLAPGESSTEELIAGIESGFLVTRFHYVNVLDRPATLLTGMTRDGTFAVRNGELAGAVHNFRFAQSVLDCLAAIEAIGSEPRAFAPDYGSFGSTVAPAVRVSAFNFASTTSH